MIKCISLALVALLLVGCHQRSMVICVEGVKYVQTSSSRQAGITVVVDENGNPRTCETGE